MDQSTSIDALNRRFGIPDTAEIIAGHGALAKIRVTTRAAAAEIYLHGAQVTSWQPAGAGDAIFLSEHSRWEDGKAIRGGIPVCFPWFRAKGDDPQAPAHGFVRTKSWQLDSVTAGEDDSVAVVCSTESDESTRRWWPYDFRLVYRITVGRALRLELMVTNIGAGSLRFEEALHTYFRVGQVQKAQVKGLDGVAYLDNTDANREKIQAETLIMKAATDNAYLNTRSAVELMDPVLRRTIRTEKENSATTVVWNPWQNGAAALSDLGNEEWQQMACVEASNILSSAISLAPGEEHTMRATLSVSPEAG
jgi:glucose-6-phosphate 1-epimerase